MTSIYIFAFGVVVTTLVGSALSILIVVKNRHLDEIEAQRDESSKSGTSHLPDASPRSS